MLFHRLAYCANAWQYYMNLAEGLLFLSTGDNYKCDIFSLKALTIQLQEPIDKLPIKDMVLTTYIVYIFLNLKMCAHLELIYLKKTYFLEMIFLK